MIVNILKFLLQFMSFLFLIVFILAISMLVYNTFYQYKPVRKEKLVVLGGGYFNTPLNQEISLISWNLGYFGLGNTMDFFYDGGKRVKPTPEEFQKSLNGILNFLAKLETTDIFLLQEVDTSSKRSYFVNETNFINEFLPLYSYVFAKNYDVRFVPFPLKDPMGKVVSGMMSLSKVKPVEAFRYPFKSHFAWPKQIFLPSRCFIYTKYRLPQGKYLVVINTHNSAYNDAAKLREEESDMLRTMMMEEYSYGNYVIVGGDWNRNPPGFNKDGFSQNEMGMTMEPALDSSFLPAGWNWVYDPAIPTNRDVSEAYKKGRTRTTIIDYFIVSPNLEVLENKTLRTNFEFSDHQPVYLKVKLAEPKPIKIKKEIKNEEEKTPNKKKIKKIITTKIINSSDSSFIIKKDTIYE